MLEGESLLQELYNGTVIFLNINSVGDWRSNLIFWQKRFPAGLLKWPKNLLILCVKIPVLQISSQLFRVEVAHGSHRWFCYKMNEAHRRCKPSCVLHSSWRDLIWHQYSHLYGRGLFDGEIIQIFIEINFLLHWIKINEKLRATLNMPRKFELKSAYFKAQMFSIFMSSSAPKSTSSHFSWNECVCLIFCCRTLIERFEVVPKRWTSETTMGLAPRLNPITNWKNRTDV